MSSKLLLSNGANSVLVRRSFNCSPPPPMSPSSSFPLPISGSFSSLFVFAHHVVDRLAGVLFSGHIYRKTADRNPRLMCGTRLVTAGDPASTSRRLQVTLTLSLYSGHVVYARPGFCPRLYGKEFYRREGSGLQPQQNSTYLLT